MLTEFELAILDTVRRQMQTSLSMIESQKEHIFEAETAELVGQIKGAISTIQRLQETGGTVVLLAEKKPPAPVDDTFRLLDTRRGQVFPGDAVWGNCAVDDGGE